MQIATTLVLATVTGLFLFMFVIPQTTVWLAGRVKKTPRLSFFQKIRLLNMLEQVVNSLSLKSLRGISSLVLVFVALIGLQHYFLLIGNGDGAKIIVTGMFVLVLVDTLQED